MDVMPKDVEIIDIKDSKWNCDKCLFFKPEEYECIVDKRLLFGQVLEDDCDDCKRPFVLKTKQFKMDMNYEYYIQKHDVSPKSLKKYDNYYDEDDDELQEQLNSMGALGWELCGIIHHPSDPDNAKFVYKRALPKETKTIHKPQKEKA